MGKMIVYQEKKVFEVRPYAPREVWVYICERWEGRGRYYLWHMGLWENAVVDNWLLAHGATNKDTSVILDMD